MAFDHYANFAGLFLSLNSQTCPILNIEERGLGSLVISDDSGFSARDFSASV